MFSDKKKPKEKPAVKRYKLPTEERLTRSAVHYLQRYATSAENLRRVLSRKVMRAAQFHERSPADFDEMIEVVVAKCRRSGMVDDAKYAEIKVASQRRRGQSQRYIEAKLRAKGVPASVVVSAIEAQETSDFDAALVLARKRKIGPWRTKGLREDHSDKDMAILCRAGFSFDVTRRIIHGDIDDLMTQDSDSQ